MFPTLNINPRQQSSAMPPRVPPPSHRHGTPSGPWPWLDIETEVDHDQLASPGSPVPDSGFPCTHFLSRSVGGGCWCGYPQSLFANWTPTQQKKSKIRKVVEKSIDTCTVYHLDVLKDGNFMRQGYSEVKENNKESHWRSITEENFPEDARVQALFIDNLSGPVLQMLGTKYTIEPFFFSSSLGWIPSRYQENVVPGVSDHITITLTFIRPTQNPATAPSSSDASQHTTSTISRVADLPSDLVIDTQAPLHLCSSDVVLVADLLALHMIRSPNGSTVISYHPPQENRATTAQALHRRFHSTGRSVYWSTIFSEATDPTFVFLSLLWYPLYAWDEAMENLYSHICWLETRVINTNDIQLTQELHAVRAHLLHYESLLQDFKKTVQFVKDTPYPGLQQLSADGRHNSEELLKRECMNLMGEIDRMEMGRSMQDMRLKNVMNLGFSSVNIEDSRRMQKLTEAAARDSAAMKQIAYLSMVFLPASFVATAFGMNVVEINPGSGPTLSQYFATAIPLTAITIWIVVAFQIQIKQSPAEVAVEINDSETEEKVKRVTTPEPSNVRALKKLGLWSRLGWPAVLFSALFQERMERRRQRRSMGLI
ncbi:hypothetical protein BDQ12DRAFT_707942 [Crucibulum laeve]|uniref:Cora-like Mg2+ transporter protein-domain-containing protein n=1 Tax=Crucibulum laeve TaxID=68775 RepID=A0A5C3LI85_9AGAR|nr:hypothetical protein BDQ12DRAFT_707942 [Crucibulum laeve]